MISKFLKFRLMVRKKVREKSWFSRGNLLYLQGVRRGDAFIPKAYKKEVNIEFLLWKITSVEGDKIIFTDKRYDEEWLNYWLWFLLREEGLPPPSLAAMKTAAHLKMEQDDIVYLVSDN